MDKIFKKSKLVYACFFASIFLFYFFLSYNTPLTGDDWTWGTNRGLIRLEKWFADYNGRYVSNILEILLTRYDILRYLTLAFFSTLLIYIIGKLTNHTRGIISWLLAFIFLLLIPINIFSQTFGWTAGFVNYVPSIVLLLCYISMVKNILYEIPPVYRNSQLVLVVPLGIITQLIVEHVSLFTLFTGALVILYTYFKFKRFYLLHFLYLGSVLFGSTIMFSNSAYWNVMNGSDSYRSLREETSNSTGLLEKIYSVYSENMYKLMFIESPFVNTFIGIMIIILIVFFMTNNRWINFCLKPLLISIISGFILYILIFRPTLDFDVTFISQHHFEALFSILFFVSILLSILLFIEDSNFKVRITFYLLGVILLSAPFVFITPYGPRAALAPFIFLVLIALELFSYNALARSWSTRLMLKPLISTILVLVIGYSYIFNTIGSTNRERIAHIQNTIAADGDVIYLPDIPFSQFLWMSTPPNSHFLTMFKRFYNIPENKDIIFFPYNEWKVRTKEDLKGESL